MITFITTKSGVVIEYIAEFTDNSWAWEELQSNMSVKISKIFSFEEGDLNNPPQSEEDFYSYTYQFQLGKFLNEYLVIPGRILNIKNDVHISKDLTLARNIFVAERDISIFGRLSNLIEHSNPILIGGQAIGSIPSRTFYELLQKFPNTNELKKYANARVHTILAQYLDGMKDARGSYEKYLVSKKLDFVENFDLNGIKKFEVEKFTLIKETIEDALVNKSNWDEKSWQKLMVQFLLLLFPKYILVLENVTIYDYYSDPMKKTNRFLDIALIDANGNLDVIEIKKPFDDKILHKSEYRGNSIPTAELSGSVMQAEKYVFHLSKWGAKGESILTNKYSSRLPSGMTIRISNPRAIIIVGRDQIGNGSMNQKQKLDFEIIKRKYINMLDIITYDDLLRRLSNTISALQK